jgi:hypothetical protein
MMDAENTIFVHVLYMHVPGYQECLSEDGISASLHGQ